MTSAKKVDENLQTNVTGNLVKEVNEVTGLHLKADGGNNLAYEKDEHGNPVVDKDLNGKEMGSATARNLIIRAIDNKETTVNLSYTYGKDSKSDDLNIALDPVQIMKFSEGAVGLNKKTAGIGLTFFHELGHTDLGGKLTDNNSQFGNLGDVETKIVNPIRRELGIDYGQRRSYKAITGFDGKTYIPFSEQAFSDIKTSSRVSGSYIKYDAFLRRTDIRKAIDYFKFLR